MLVVFIILWPMLGLLVGLLAVAARFVPATWGAAGWFWLLALGMVSALVGGLIDTWLYGKLFATAAALLVAVVVTAIPWLVKTVHITWLKQL